MRASLRITVKVVTAIFLVSFAVVVMAISFVRWQFHLPSDARAKAYFDLHRDELERLVAMVDDDYDIDFVDARSIGHGSAARDPKHLACAEQLRKIGAQSLRHGRGVIEIYFWSSGCTICHDSYKGFAYIREPKFDMPPDWKLCGSLETRALPRGKYAPVEDGTYLAWITDHWYLIRWENG